MAAVKLLALNYNWACHFFAGAGCLYKNHSDCDDSGVYFKKNSTKRAPLKTFTAKRIYRLLLLV